MNHHTPAPPGNPWPHRLAVLLVFATFVLICAGALVTTLGAGMAFRDWPTSDGHNMFLYPWFEAATDKFLEHGHRLLGATVGLITIALAAALWWADDRRWVAWLGACALMLVIVQGVLGGLRVRADALSLAKIHGCTGPAFFALTVVLATVTSRWWRQSGVSLSRTANSRFPLMTIFLACLCLLQLILGSQLRHVSAQDPAGIFRIALFFHLLLAGVLLVYSIWMARRTSTLGHSKLKRPAVLLAVLVVLQLVLGGGAWVVKYSWPAGLFPESIAIAGWTNIAGGGTEALVVTGHVAMGSLILATSVLLALRSVRLIGIPLVSALPGTLCCMEAVR